jgi:hypothetical protein
MEISQQRDRSRVKYGRRLGYTLDGYSRLVIEFIRVKYGNQSTNIQIDIKNVHG